MSKPTRKRHQHTVPRFHLRGFASAEGEIAQTDLRTGSRRLVSISNAAVVKNFYALTLSDGTRSDVWEDWLGDLENDIAPQVRRAIQSTTWHLSSDERGSLARWIAVQYLRGTDNRRMMAETAGMMWRMIIGMGGLAYLRHTMQEGLQREVSWQEAEAVWEDVHSSDGPQIAISANEHLAILARSVDEATDFVLNRSWHRVRFGRHSLALNDTPVALLRAADHPEFLGVGLANAGAITVALDRRTMLWLDNPMYPSADLAPSTALARGHNRAVVFGAERFVYTHPDDPDPSVGLDLSGLRGRQLAASGAHDFANRDRPLEDVLAQIAERDSASSSAVIADYSWPIPGYSPKI